MTGAILSAIPKRQDTIQSRSNTQGAHLVNAGYIQQSLTAWPPNQNRAKGCSNNHNLQTLSTIINNIQNQEELLIRK